MGKYEEVLKEVTQKHDTVMITSEALKIALLLDIRGLLENLRDE